MEETSLQKEKISPPSQEEQVSPEVLEESLRAIEKEVKAPLKKVEKSPTEIEMMKDNDTDTDTEEDTTSLRDIGDIQVVESLLLSYIPEESARYYSIVPLMVEQDGTLIVGTPLKNNIDAKDVLNFISGKEKIPYRLVHIQQTQYDAILKQYSETATDVKNALSEYEKSEDATTYIPPSETDVIFSGDAESLKGSTAEAPIIKMVNSIIVRAVDLKASDIHVEPSEKDLIIRFRVDGNLIKGFTLPKKVHAAVTAQIKIRAHIRIDEKRIPQDGSFSALVRGKRFDFRVATLPTSDGEKVVLRLLDNEQGVMSYEEIGLLKSHINIIEDAIMQPYGMLLVSGPTGSGKTTSVYSILGKLDKGSKNIVSLEDPVEYNITGINQSRIRPEIGYTFATGLRSILRGDPDIIFVGEIRDQETAHLAVQAALTGHIVISTIHTNTAIGVIPRLIDMGIDPYLIAPTLTAVIGQRLVRRICGEGEAIAVDGHLKRQYEEQFMDLPSQYKETLPPFNRVYNPVPTAECPMGTQGRIAVAEAYSIDKEVERLIFTKPSEQQIFSMLRKKGFMTIREDGMIKAVNGVIPFSEVDIIGRDDETEISLPSQQKMNTQDESKKEDASLSF